MLQEKIGYDHNYPNVSFLYSACQSVIYTMVFLDQVYGFESPLEWLLQLRCEPLY